jgi:threonine/homoserine/homoserine lactone efflux protein
MEKKNLVQTYSRRLGGEIPSVVTAIAIVCACFFGYYTFKRTNKGKAEYSVGSSVINAVVIVVLGTIYRFVSRALVNWENHRYQEDWENSLITKSFSFQFVNAYISLFTIAFVDQSFNELAQSLAIILAAKQIGMNLLDVFLPMLKVSFRKKKLDKRF